MSGLPIGESDGERTVDRRHRRWIGAGIEQGQHLQRGPGTRDMGQHGGGDGGLACRPLHGGAWPRGIGICQMQVSAAQAGAVPGDHERADDSPGTGGRHHQVGDVEGHRIGVGCGIGVGRVAEDDAGVLSRGAT